MRVSGEARTVLCALALALLGSGVGPGAATAATKVFRPVADARVQSSAANANYGGSSELRADASPTIRSFLRFDVRGLTGQVARATFRFHARTTGTSTRTLELRGVASNAWGESTITHSNAPAVGAVAARSGALTDGHWISIDATKLITGEGLRSMALTTTSTSTLRLSSREVAAEAPQLIVQTAAPGDAVVAAAGDIACDPGSSAFNGGLGTATQCRQRYTSDLLLQPGLSAVLPLGDLQYENGALSKFQQSYDPSWGRVLALTRPVPGNHEYQVAGAAGYFDYFNGVGQQTGRAGDRTTGYYSYDLGAWHLLALNSNCAAIGGCGAGSPQERWLRADLAANPDSCTLAYWHSPRFSSGTEHGSDPITAALWNALDEAGADVLLTGHEHNYERFSRQTSGGAPDPAGGIRQFVVGTGGKSLYRMGAVARNSGARDTSSFGVLKLILGSGGYDWSFVPAEGSSFTDTGSDVCTGPTVDSEPPGKPARLRATLAGGVVDLEWSASTDNDGVASYAILRDGQQIASSTTAAYTDASVQPGRTYEYTVVAYDSLGNSSPAATPVSVTTPGSTSFTPTDDASISAANPGGNFGSSTALDTDGSPDEDFLVKFRVSGVGPGPVSDATLRLRNRNGSPFGGEIHAVDDDSWTEATVTWSNAPAADPGIVGSLGPVAPGTWYEVDVGSVVSGDGTYSFRVTSPDADGAGYYSSEASAGSVPKLVVAP